MLAQKVSQIKDIFCELCKKDKKKCRVQSHFDAPGFFFFAHPAKNVFSSRNFLANITCSVLMYIRNFYLDFFDILKNDFRAVGASTPMIQYGFPR